MPLSEPPNAISGQYHWECSDQIDPDFQAKEAQWALEERLERAQRIAQDDLRRRIFEQIPQIATQAQRIENALRELVDFERSKLPPKHNWGYLILKANKAKAKPKDPDVVGSARIGSSHFKAFGYSNSDPIGEKFLKITLSPTPSQDASAG